MEFKFAVVRELEGSHLAPRCCGPNWRPDCPAGQPAISPASAQADEMGRSACCTLLVFVPSANPGGRLRGLSRRSTVPWYLHPEADQLQDEIGTLFCVTRELLIRSTTTR
jgi:hypothetical protein